MDSNPSDAPVTQGDLDALRNELKAVQRRSALETVRTHARIDALREDLRREMRVMFSDVIGKVDGFMSGVGKIDRAQAIVDWRLTELEKRVKNIESRPS